MKSLAIFVLFLSLAPDLAIAQQTPADSAQINEFIESLQSKDAEIQSLMDNQRSELNNRITEEKLALQEEFQILRDRVAEEIEENNTNKVLLNVLYALGIIGVGSVIFLGQRLFGANKSIKELEERIEKIQNKKLDDLSEQIDSAMKSARSYIIEEVVKKTEEASISNKAAFDESLVVGDQDQKARIKSRILVLYRPPEKDGTSDKDRMEDLLIRWRFPMDKDPEQITFQEMNLKRLKQNTIPEGYDVVLFDDHDKATREEKLFLHLLDTYPKQNYLLYSNYQLRLPDKYVDMSINFARSPFTLYGQLMNVLKYTLLMKEG